MSPRPQMRPRDPARLSEAMSEAGLDTVSLGAQVGKSKQFLALLTTGKRGCKRETAAAIAKALGQPVSALFFTPMLSEYPYNRTEVDVTTLTEDPYLLLTEVAELTRIAPATLQMYRAAGTGPPFFRQGRWLKCRRSKVLAWMATFEPADELAVK